MVKIETEKVTTTPLLEGEFKGVKWRSLSPPQEVIRAQEIERLSKKHKIGSGEASLIFFQKKTFDHIHDPVIVLAYHRRISNYSRNKYSS